MNNEMKNELAVTNTSTNEIVLYQPNETIQLEVRLQDETVWLNQQQIAVLFGTQRQAITKHLKNIFESGELERQATCSILELVQKEGNRMVIVVMLKYTTWMLLYLLVIGLIPNEVYSSVNGRTK